MSEVAVIPRRGAPESAPQSAGRILIVDDEQEIRESLETLLELEGYRVTVLERGARVWPRSESAVSMSCCSTWPCPTRMAWRYSPKSARRIQSWQSS